MGFFSLGEQFQTTLTQTLQSNSFYYAEFWVKTSSDDLVSNNLGLLFSTDKVFTKNSYQSPIIANPQVNLSEISYDTIEWRKISGVFEAKESYKYMSVGNFFGVENTKFDTLATTSKYSLRHFSAYHYVDDFLVRKATEKEIGKFKSKQQVAISKQLKNAKIEIENIYFGVGSSKLNTNSTRELDKLANYLTENSLLFNQVIIKGFADSTGDSLANSLLSQKRAEEVKNYLESKGIARQSLIAKGLGEQKADSLSHDKNRRTEFIFELNSKNANSEILFEELLNFNAIKSKSKTQQKLIFLDAYTIWCGPCKWLEEKTFKDSKVARFFNENFVNTRMNMESEEGLPIAKSYKITSYPTLLFLDFSGKEVLRVEGYKNASDLLQIAKNTLDPTRNLVELKKKYGESKRGFEFIKLYVDVFKEHGLNYNSVLDEYFRSLKPESKVSPQSYQLIKEYVFSTESEGFKLLEENKKVFSEKVGENEISQLMFFIYRREIGNLTFSGGDSTKYERIRSKILLTDLSGKEKLVSQSDLAYYPSKSDWNSYAKSVVEFGSNFNENQLLEAIKNINKNEAERSLLENLLAKFSGKIAHSSNANLKQAFNRLKETVN
jgi:outer membrane protein OmpA-like peptidoglycan-associated protein/thioredoxin-related protein